jgi:uncharacterized protein YueI
MDRMHDPSDRHRTFASPWAIIIGPSEQMNRRIQHNEIGKAVTRDILSHHEVTKSPVEVMLHNHHVINTELNKLAVSIFFTVNWPERRGRPTVLKRSLYYAVQKSEQRLSMSVTSKRT